MRIREAPVCSAGCSKPKKHDGLSGTELRTSAGLETHLSEDYGKNLITYAKGRNTQLRIGFAIVK
jgi:hypothetical protein